VYEWNKAEWQAFLDWLADVRSDNACLGQLAGLEDLYNEYLAQEEAVEGAEEALTPT